MGLPTSPPSLGAKAIEFTAKHKVEGTRLDQYLVIMFPGYSRSVIRKVIDASAVMVNGGPAKASHKVRYGDQIRIWLPEATHEVPQAEDIALDVLYEDEFLAVINKPA